MDKTKTKVINSFTKTFDNDKNMCYYITMTKRKHGFQKSYYAWLERNW